ncbi:hypothetical protein BLOT_005880 [Blomia tropicalis]|nr:hypothetical protein BLOT_005880 [Blomia tropicalis]
MVINIFLINLPKLVIMRSSSKFHSSSGRLEWLPFGPRTNWTLLLHLSCWKHWNLEDESILALLMLPMYSDGHPIIHGKRTFIIITVNF